MFEIGWGELFFIGIVALLVLGPDEFPRALKTMGQWVKKLKDAATSVQSQVQDAIKEVDSGIGLDAVKPATLMEPLKDIEFFGDDLAKAWNADILQKEVAAVEPHSKLLPLDGGAAEQSEAEGVTDSSHGASHPHPPAAQGASPLKGEEGSIKPRVRVKARRSKKGKAIETMEAEG